MLTGSGIHSGVTYGVDNENDVYDGDQALVTGEFLFYRMLVLEY